MNLGPLEILLILVLALVLFGPKRLPEVGRQVGAAMRELRRMQDSVRADLREVFEEPPTPPAPRPGSLPATGTTPAPTEEPVVAGEPPSGAQASEAPVAAEPPVPPVAEEPRDAGEPAVRPVAEDPAPAEPGPEPA